jgi:small-conductance mechanosensitive channel
MSKEEGSTENKLELQSLQLMGLFLGVFGIVMLIAIIFPENLEGKIASLISGLALLGCGIGAYLKGIKRNFKK